MNRPTDSLLALLALLALLSGLVAEAPAAETRPAYPVAPAIHGDLWINSRPLSPADLEGKVRLVEFWTFGCWNCRNVEPWIQQWHARYARQGLRILAVHSPEFPHEARFENVARYVREQKIAYVVPVDNEFVTWKRFGNRAWPTLYLIDRAGQIRYRHIGEGGYAATERMIKQLLAEPDPDQAGS
jgi:thiol-disulfide isomerase/thioredoxin